MLADIRRRPGWWPGALVLVAACAPVEVTTPGSIFDYPPAVRQVQATAASVFVFDADTLRVGDVRVRLDGIAAPEDGHPAYLPGRRFLDALIRRAGRIECALTGKRSYRREIGYCWVALDGQRVDVQAELVAAGLARDCPRYSSGRYRELEGARARQLPLPGYCR